MVAQETLVHLKNTMAGSVLSGDIFEIPLKKSGCHRRSSTTTNSWTLIVTRIRAKNKFDDDIQKVTPARAPLALAKLEKEIELQLAKNKALSLNPAAKVEEKQFETNIENMIKSIKTLSLPVPTRSENFNLFFQSLERAFLTKKINDEYKSKILINLLGERAHNVLDPLLSPTNYGGSAGIDKISILNQSLDNEQQRP
ncbi:uncharacterized protein TNCV_3412261 [Trichonephila clavipes]|uniref:Uncharacterized protein n=1 Tax=Trichonephila clavipes TaxID=2585209 RepID=A0A8X6RF54_TRICX|nr:uncharacterized protein TNCV_3412261 [Trichonephila clavipes]